MTKNEQKVLLILARADVTSADSTLNALRAAGLIAPDQPDRYIASMSGEVIRSNRRSNRTVVLMLYATSTDTEKSAILDALNALPESE